VSAVDSLAVDGLRPDEQLAADVLASRIGGSIDPKDVGAAQATHEFDVVLPDGSRIAVEVTAATDQPTERLRGERRRDYPAPELAANWNVWMPQDPALDLRRDLMPKLPPLIAVLERHGVAHVGRFVEPPTEPEAAEAAERISKLRVHRALRLGPPEDGAEPGLFVAMTTGVGSDFDSLNALVAERAEAKRDKLAAAVADERHLFVWVRHDGAELAMATLPPPPTAPELPTCIDVAWAATGGLGGGLRVLYRLERGGSWEVVT
jgi:hypothetical protein